MATNNTPQGGEYSLDLSSLELDDFGMSDPFNPDPPDDRLRGSGPIRDLKTGFRDSFKNSNYKTRILERIIRAALPPGYARTWTAAEAVYDKGQDIYRHVRTRSAPELADVARESEKILPRLKGKTPDKLYKAIERNLSRVREDLEDEVRYQRGTQGAFRNGDDQSLEGIDALLKGQAEITQWQADHDDAQEARERAERGVRDRIDTHRHAAQSERLHNIADGLGRLGRYQEGVDFRFKRKALELQYRSFFALRDIAEQQKKFDKFQTTAYEALVHNTGLPENFKYRHGERLEKDVRRRMSDRLKRHAGETLSQYGSEFGGRLAENVKSTLTNSLQMAMSGQSMFSGMGGSAGNMAGTFLGMGAQDFLENRVAGELGRLLRPQVQRAADRFGGSDKTLNYYLNNAPGMLQRYGQSLNVSEGFFGRSLRGLVGNLTPMFMPDAQLSGGGFHNLGETAVFNQLTQRSIVEVIPGYLSRMLHELRMTRTGDENLEREVFDTTAGKFTGFKRAGNALLRRLMPNGSREVVGSTLEATLDRYDPDGKLSPQARRALGERLLREASTNGYFDPESFARGDGYENDLDDQVLEELQHHFNSIFELDEDGRFVGTTENRRQRDRLSTELVQLRNALPDPTAAIRRLFEAGDQDMIRRLGLVENVNGRDRISQEAIRRYYQNPDMESPLDDLIPGGMASGGQSATVRHVPTPPPDTEAFSERLFDKLSRLQGPQASFDYRTHLDHISQIAREESQQRRNFEQTLLDRLDAGIKISDLPNLRFTHDGNAEMAGDGPQQRRKPKLDFWDRVANMGRRTGEGLWAGGKAGVKGIYSGAEQLQRGIFKTAGGLGGFVGGAVKGGSGMLLDATGIRRQDVFLKGRPKEPIITARQLREGKYVNADNQKRIYKLSDITGAIIDPETQEYLITAEEFAEGLYDRRGQSLIRKGLSGLMGFYQNAYLNPMAKVASLIPKAAGMFIEAANTPHDVYVKGERTPRMLARLMRRGRYIDEETQKPIERYSDITGNVLFVREEGEPEVVITADEIPHLVNRDGDPLETKVQKWGRRAKGLASLPWRMLKGAGGLARDAYSAFASIAGSLRGGIEGIFGHSGRSAGQKNWQEAMLDNVQGIYQLLQDRIEPRYRKGSWEEQLKAQADNVGKGDGKEGTGRQTAGSAGVFAGLKGLYDKLTGKNKEETPASDEDSWLDKARDAKDIDDLTGNRGKKGLGKLWGRMKGAGKFLKGSAGRVAMGAAGLLSTGSLAGVGSALLGGATAVGGGLLAVATSPITLTALGIGAAAYGGYKLWQWSRQWSPGRWGQLRMLQYGVDLSDTDHVQRVHELEKYYSDAMVDDGGDYRVDGGRIEVGRILSIMGVEGRDETPEQQARIEALGYWLGDRFKIVMGAWYSALQRFAPQVALGDMDNDLPSGVGHSMLDAVTFTEAGDTPYAVTVVPWGEGTTTVTLSDIQAQLQVIRNGLDKDGGQDRQVKTASGATAALGALGRQAHVDNTLTASNRQQQALDRTVLSTAVTLGGGVPQSDNNRNYVTRTDQVVFTPHKGSVLDSLETIRIRAYGLKELSRARVDALFTLEQFVFEQLKSDGEGRVTFTGDSSSLMQQYSGLFGINTSNEIARARFITWLDHRFLPVVLAFAGSVRRFNNSLPLVQADTRLSASQKVAIGRAIIGATTTFKDTDTPIWDIPFNPFGNDGGEDSDDRARGELSYLEGLAAKERYRTQGQFGVSKDGTVEGRPLIFPRDPNAPASTPKTGVERNLDFINKLGGRPDTSGKTQQGFKGGVPYALPNANGGTTARGNEYHGLSEGNGGLWESLPMPTSEDYNGSRATIEAAAAMTGIDAGLLASFIGIESRFKWKAKNPDSNAVGWMQFMPPTWKEMLQRYGAKYGLGANALRTDPRAAVLMGAEFIRENTRALQKRIGRLPTDTDLYTAHFMGAGGAGKFLNADPNQSAAALQPAEAQQNANIYYDKGRPRTVAEVYAVMDAKMQEHRYGGGTSTTSRSVNTTGTVPSIYDAQIPEPAVMEEVRREPPAMLAPPPVAIKQQLSDTGPQFQVPRSPLSLDNETASPSFATGAPLLSDDDSDRQMLQREQRRDAQQAQQQEQARLQQRQQQERARRDDEFTLELRQIQRDQLETQIEMCGYLRDMAVYFKEDTPRKNSNDTTTPRPTSSNDTTQSNPRGGKPRQGSGPISMTR